MRRISDPARARTRASATVAFAVIAVAGLAPRTVRSAENASAMRIVVASGPVAGTYAMPRERVLCVSTAAGISASFKYFAIFDPKKPGVTTRVRDATALSEAQIIVDNPTDRGTKTGSLELTFGNRHEHPIKYLVFAPAGGSLAQTNAGTGVALAFKGRTKDGVAVDASATCRDVEKL